VLNETTEVIDALGGVITYSYDAIGRLIATDGALPGVVDRSTMSYNKLGHKLSMDDPDKGAWQYRYNVLGEIVCQVDARDMGSRLQYDDLGRVVARTDYKDLHDIYACIGTLQGLTSVWRITTPQDRRRPSHHPNPAKLQKYARCSCHPESQH